MGKLSLALIVALACTGCDTRDGAEAGVEGAGGAEVAPGEAVATPQAAFMDNLRQHCGRAYSGRLTLEPAGDEMLTGTEELIVHFRECGQDTLRLPFHLEQEDAGTWDRSRTWMFMQTADALEIRHDHRHEDGTPDEQTMYGAYTQDAGMANRQEFILTERRAPDGSPLGWRVEIEPGQRYTYGTIRGGEWSWRVDFDLTTTVPAPPAPWGHP
ncbi:hypothetical protein BH23GEM9_BH23GEM9_21980 [soil metagenome]